MSVFTSLCCRHVPGRHLVLMLHLVQLLAKRCSTCIRRSKHDTNLPPSDHHRWCGVGTKFGSLWGVYCELPSATAGLRCASMPHVLVPVRANVVVPHANLRNCRCDLRDHLHVPSVSRRQSRRSDAVRQYMLQQTNCMPPHSGLHDPPMRSGQLVSVLGLLRHRLPDPWCGLLRLRHCEWSDPDQPTNVGRAVCVFLDHNRRCGLPHQPADVLRTRLCCSPYG